MHELFPDWYRQVAVEPTPDRLESRWGAVAELSATTDDDAPLALELVRLAFDRRLQEETRGRLVEHFRKGDAAFPARENDLELRILASAAVVDILTRSSDTADATGLAVTGASFAGHKAVVDDVRRAGRGVLDVRGCPSP